MIHLRIYQIERPPDQIRPLSGHPRDKNLPQRHRFRADVQRSWRSFMTHIAVGTQSPNNSTGSELSIHVFSQYLLGTMCIRYEHKKP